MTRVTINPDTATDAELRPLLSIGSIENVRDVLRSMAPHDDSCPGCGARMVRRPTEADLLNGALERLARDGMDRAR